MAQRLIDRRTFGLALAAGVVAPAAAGAAEVTVGSASRLTPLAQQPYTPPTSISTVADMYRRMTAPVRIADQGPFAFVVDTGANRSVIARELAATLGLVMGPQVSINGAAGTIATPSVEATLKLGPRPAATMAFAVLPQADIGGLGLLGLDAVGNQLVTLDFKGQTLKVETPGRLWRDPNDVAIKATRRDGQMTLVDADLAGIAITAFLDSGAQNTIGNLTLREMAIARRPATPWFATVIASATGQTINAEMLDLPNLRVGGLRLPNWPVAFADLHTFRMWNLVKRPAILLGVDVLSRFETVCLDFSRNEVRFRLPRAGWG